MSFDVQPGILDRRTARVNRALDQARGQAFQLGAAQVHVQVLGTAGIRRDERQVDFGVQRAGKLDLGFLGGFLQALERLPVAAQVDARFFLELVGDPVDDDLIEVVAAEVGVAVGAADFKHAVADFEDRNVERAAAEVVDGDHAVLLARPTHRRGSTRSAR